MYDHHVDVQSGQGDLVALLHERHDLLHDLLVELGELPRPRRSTKRFDYLDRRAGEVVEVDGELVLPLHRDEWDIYAAFHAARERYESEQTSTRELEELPGGPPQCANCGRVPSPEEEPLYEWRVASDEAGVLRRYCPVCVKSLRVYEPAVTSVEILREQFGDGYEEALGRYSRIRTTINKAEAEHSAPVVVLPLRTMSGKPLPPRRSTPDWPRHFAPKTKDRVPVPRLFAIAVEKAKEIGVADMKVTDESGTEHRAVFRSVQGKRSERYDDIKRARLEIARHLRGLGATHAEIGQVLGGITASVVSRMLKEEGDE